MNTSSMAQTGSSVPKSGSSHSRRISSWCSSPVTSTLINCRLLLNLNLWLPPFQIWIYRLHPVWSFLAPKKNLSLRFHAEHLIWSFRYQRYQFITRNVYILCHMTSPRTLTLWYFLLCNWKCSSLDTITTLKLWISVQKELSFWTNTTPTQFGKNSLSKEKTMICTSRRSESMKISRLMSSANPNIFNTCRSLLNKNLHS